ncbi:tubulin--tyrosine ligase [Platysternon megacephalum]|uniref:Tubulin--tyrosine ligase n=1 Tax=Platysternon megacephalum TaxID=55544 RepID=A0A4D9DZL5_9SAUR|nr:tubulin--tyrosine ligase [Platysternon megacephalum]
MQSCVFLAMPKPNVSEAITRHEEKARTPGRRGCFALPAAMGLFKKRLLFYNKNPTPAMLPRSVGARPSTGQASPGCLRAHFTYTPNYFKISKYFGGEEKGSLLFYSSTVLSKTCF